MPARGYHCTVRLVLAVCWLPPLGVKVAVMVVVPVRCSVARPGVMLLKIATEVSEEFQVVELVTIWPLLVAVNCTEPVDRFSVAFVGLMTNVLLLLPTVRVEEPLTVPSVAVMVALPALTPFATPVAETVAIVLAEVVQVTLWSEAVVPSLLTPLAVNCAVAPILTEAFCGATLIVVRLGLTKNPRHEIPPTATSTATASSGSIPLFRISQDSMPRWANSFDC